MMLYFQTGTTIPTSTMVRKVFWTNIEWGEHLTTIIFRVDFIFSEGDDIVMVTLVKSAYSPTELG
jgi:hypothetical protein